LSGLSQQGTIRAVFSQSDPGFPLARVEPTLVPSRAQSRFWVGALGVLAGAGRGLAELGRAIRGGGRVVVRRFFLSSSLLASVGGVAWQALVREWVPRAIRGKFFAARTRLIQASMLIFVLGAGAWLARADYSIGIFQLPVFAMVAARAVSLIAQQSRRPRRAARSR
jgi:hypothetical protein